MITKEEIKSVIFDLDGVIVSTDEYHFESWRQLIIKNFGIEIKQEFKDILRGVSRKDSLIEISKAYELLINDESEFNNLLEEKNNYYVSMLEDLKEGDEFDGVIEFLELLKSKDIKAVLASSSRNATNILKKLNLIKYFDSVVNVDELKSLKPDPEIFIKAAEQSGVPLNNCVVIEDAQAGIDGSIAAGIPVIAYNESNQDLRNYDLEVKTYNELINLIR